MPAKPPFAPFITAPASTNANNLGRWSEGSGGLELVARTGSQTPGLPAGVNYGIMAPAGLNDAGQIMFAVALSGSGVNSSNNQGVWSDVSGSLALVARTGSHVPGLPIGVTINDLVDTGAINNAGQIAFVAGLSNDNSTYTQDIIWLYDSGSMTPLFVRGEQPPGTAAGVTYDVFGFWPCAERGGASPDWRPADRQRSRCE